MRLRYRVAQFWRTLFPQKLSTAEGLQVKRILNDSEWDLFTEFSAADQKHSYLVFRTLQLNGCDDQELLAAALLHDVGKSKFSLSAWERSLIVICDFLVPKKVALWGREEGKRWKRPFVVRAQHPQWGANMAESAGSKSMVINLIRRHQDPLPKNPTCLEDHFLALLQWADNQN